MKKISTLVFALLVAASANNAWADDWHYDFEDFATAFGDNYANSTLELTLNGLSWHVHGVMPSTGSSDYSEDWFNGKKSMRLYGESKKDRKLGPELSNFTLTSPRDIGKVTFSIRENTLWPTEYDGQVEWIVQWSADGQAWSTVGNSFKANTEVQTIERDVNQKNAYVRIIRADYASLDPSTFTSNTKITNFDDITITDVNGGPQAASLGFSVTTADFGQIGVGKKATQKIAVTYSGVEGVSEPTYKLTGVDTDAYSYTVEKGEVAGTDSITITCQPQHRGNSTAAITASYGDLTATVSLTVTASKARPNILFSGGEGTQDDPYVISCLEDLQELSDSVRGADRDPQAFSGRYFKMSNDIDVQKVTNFTPIGNQLKGAGAENMVMFSGNFDGDGHTVYGVKEYYSSGMSLGLFGIVKDATIKNLTLANSSFEGNASVGALVGTSLGVTTIENCHVASDVTVKGSIYAAGICASALRTEAEADAKLTLDRCTNAAAVTSDYAAGILSINSQVEVDIERCGNTGSIAASNSSPAGILAMVYFAPTTINNCYNTGSVSKTGSDWFGGGILGQTQLYTQGTPVTVTNCYNVGSISGGSITTMDPILPATYLIPGPTADTYDTDLLTLSNCYFASDINAAFSPLQGVESLQSSSMKTEDFTNSLNNGQNAKYWIFVDGLNDGYPVPLGSEATAVKGVEISEGKAPVEMFDMSGRRVSSVSAPGIYIIKQADGKTVKVMKR
ncbi:MAG: hypothetical protein ACI4BG_08185 [Prevotella sp.]